MLSKPGPLLLEACGLAPVRAHLGAVSRVRVFLHVSEQRCPGPVRFLAAAAGTGASLSPSLFQKTPW